ncbi:MAG: hypothetical protein Q8P18_26865 [Pseudomonadota bacterium]|nr:hypothetical protein [Pseudomonadota bacterium]
MSVKFARDILPFLRVQADRGIGSFTATPIVVAGLANDEEHAIALLLSLSQDEILTATAIVRCDRGHDKAWIEPYLPGMELPEGPCDECAGERRENFEEGGIVLVFGKGPAFAQFDQPPDAESGKVQRPSGRQGTLGSGPTESSSTASRGYWGASPSVLLLR